MDRNFSVVHVADGAEVEVPVESRQAMLKELFGRLNKAHFFSKGQFVKWKPGLKNRKFPEYGEPVIVTEVINDPVFDPNENCAASPYFQEPLTVVIGTYRDADLLEFRLDGRRLEPFEP